MTRWVRAAAAAVCLAVGGGFGCGSDDDAAGDALNRGIPGTPGFEPQGGSSASPTPGAGNVPGTTGQPGAMDAPQEPPPLMPEVEVEIGFEQPQASERYVYVANPSSGTVSIIEAETLAIQTLETGREPTFLKTLAGSDDAIVLNVGNDEATIIRDPAGGARSVNVDVVDGANAIAVAPDGAHAVVYFDSRFGGSSGSGSFQDVTVIRLEEGADDAVDMTVGFRPRDVFFAADGSAGYVVTEDGVSELDFARIDRQGTGIARLISLGNDIDRRALDVSVTPDGRFALTRAEGASVVRLVSLQSGDIRALDLADVVAAAGADDDADAGSAEATPVEVTDLDLSPDGSFALAVARTHSTVLRIPVPAGFDDADLVEAYVIEGELIGSATLAPDGEQMLLYTTAVDAERITLLDLSIVDPTPQTVALRKAIEAVAVAPDSATALIIHDKQDGDPAQPGLDPDTMIDRSFGYSVLRMASGDVKLQVTPTQPGSFTMVPPQDAPSQTAGEGYLFILFRADALGVREVQRVEAKSFLVQPIGLLTPPLSLGAVPSSRRVFVNEEHPDGRITLINWETGSHQTVTGFELNSRIRD